MALMERLATMNTGLKKFGPMQSGFVRSGLLLGIACFVVNNVATAQQMVRIQDITTLKGEHPNTITGIGLVTGLAGTGGSSPTTKQFALQFLQKMGNRAEPALRQNIQQSQEKTNNVSVVSVTAILPPHARPGQRIDVIVSTLDDAKGLQGGVLLETELTATDDVVYALASGPISINGGEFGGNAATVTKNHPNTGRISQGAVIEADVPCTIFDKGVFSFLLRQPDYSTADRMNRALNLFSPGCAAVVDPAMVAVRLPSDAHADPYRFIAECQELMVEPGEKARVVINERTGTIVIGDSVKLSRVAITHGNIIVSTVESPEVSQPGAFANGATAVVPRTSVDVTEQSAVINVLKQNATVGDLAVSLNALGVSPRDLSVILQMLKEAGALHADVTLL